MYLIRVSRGAAQPSDEGLPLRLIFCEVASAIFPFQLALVLKTLSLA